MDIVALFCDLDDFCQGLEPWMQRQMLTIGRRRRSTWEMAPEILLAIMVGLFVAQPVAYLVQQRVTTDAAVRHLRVAGVTQEQFAGQVAHFVRLERD